MQKAVYVFKMSSVDVEGRVIGQRNAVVTATPNGTSDVCGIQNHITPEGLQEDQEEIRSQEPDTPCKEFANKKNPLVIKPGSKRKLFLQTDRKQGFPPVGRPKKPHQSGGSLPIITGGVSHFPLTERQQLQYLLEVTAQQAKNEEKHSDTESGSFTKIKRKEIGKENNINLRLHKKNERGETALHLAAIKGDLDDVVTLIKAGANVNGKDYAGWTPLHEACNHGHLQVVKELVIAGACVNAPGFDELTPLHDAVINDHIQVIEFLLQHGADPQMRAAKGQKATDLASSSAAKTLLLGSIQESSHCDPLPAMELSGQTSLIQSEATDCQLKPTRHDRPTAPKITGQTSGQSQNIIMPLDSAATRSATSKQVEAQRVRQQLPDSSQPQGEKSTAAKQLPTPKVSKEYAADKPMNAKTPTVFTSELMQFDKNKNNKVVNKQEDPTDDCVSLSKLNQCLTNAAAEMSSYLECKEVLFLDSEPEHDFLNYNKSEVSLTQKSRKGLSNTEEKITVSSDKNMSPIPEEFRSCSSICVGSFMVAEKVSTEFDKDTSIKKVKELEESSLQSEFNKNNETKLNDNVSIGSNSMGDKCKVHKPLKRNDSTRPKSVSPRKRRRSTVLRANTNLDQSDSSSIQDKTLETSSSDNSCNNCSSAKKYPASLRHEEENSNYPTPTTSNTTCTIHMKTPTPCASQTKTPAPYTSPTRKPISCASQTTTTSPCTSQTKTPISCASQSKTPTLFSSQTKTTTPCASQTKTPTPCASQTETPTLCSSQTVTTAPCACQAKIPTLCASQTKLPTPCATASQTKTPISCTNQTKTNTPCASQTKTTTHDMCSNHIKTPTWRRAVAKHRYQISNLPVHVPSFEKFIMHTKSYSLLKLSKELDNLPSRVITEKSDLEDLKIRHKVEKEKLKLCVEQELVRAFTNFEREVIGMSVPYSACFVLRVQGQGNNWENKNFTLPGSETGSFVREEVAKILNKFEVIKQDLLRRQKLEYDAILALQHMNSDSKDLAGGLRQISFEEDFDIVPSEFREQFQRLLFQNCLI